MSETPARPVIVARGLDKRFTEGSGASRSTCTCCAASTSTVHAGRDARDRRRVGLGQEHAAASAWRARGTDRRQRAALRPRLRCPGPAEQGEWRNRHLGFVYQFHHLLPRVQRARQRGDAAAHPSHAQGRGARARSAALRLVGLGERWRTRPGQLSGGERQRSAIARSLAGERTACLPTSRRAISIASTADGVFQLLLDLAKQRAMALVLVTHDDTLAARCSRRLRLLQGKLAD
jgi:lipoprotein-releasing system ATP-binding protein